MSKKNDEYFAGIELYLIVTIRKLKLSHFGHNKRHDSLEKIFLEGMVEGRRGRGRPRRRWSQDITEWMGSTMAEGGRKAQDRNLFRLAEREATSERGMP